MRYLIEMRSAMEAALSPRETARPSQEDGGLGEGGHI